MALLALPKCCLSLPGEINESMKTEASAALCKGSAPAVLCNSVCAAKSNTLGVKATIAVQNL